MKRVGCMPSSKAALTAALMACLVGASPMAIAWVPASFYLVSVDPVMPSPMQAQQLKAVSFGMLARVRHAHQQALSAGWIGMPARDSIPDVDARAASRPAANTARESWTNAEEPLGAARR